MQRKLYIYILFLLILILPFPLYADTVGMMRPWFGPAGIVVDVIPLDDPAPFGPPYESSDFEPASPCSGVTMMQTAPTPDIPISVPVYLWSEQLVKFRVPGLLFPPGTSDTPTLASVEILQIKDPLVTSCTGNTLSTSVIGEKGSKDFVVRKTPEISLLSPDTGNWGSVVIVSGEGFWNTQEIIYDQEEIMDGSGNMDLVCDPGEKCTAYGFSTYVELYASNYKYRVSKYGDTWNDSQIVIKILRDTLLDVQTGNTVPDTALFLGDWQVQVITDYFKDTNLNGLHLMADGTIDLGDEIIMRDVGPPATFGVKTIASPYINAIIPNYAPVGSTVRIIGANFGVSGLEILGDGVGDEDGKCESDEKCEVKLWKKDHTTFKRPIVKSWSNTEIMIKVPSLSAPYPKKRDIQVKVTGATNPNSNYYMLTITKPGT